MLVVIYDLVYDLSKFKHPFGINFTTVIKTNKTNDITDLIVKIHPKFTKKDIQKRLMPFLTH